jgi:flagellin
LNDLAAINQFTAVGTNGTIISSTDGIAWTRQTSNTNTDLLKILRAENQLIAVNSAGGIFSSK